MTITTLLSILLVMSIAINIILFFILKFTATGYVDDFHSFTEEQSHCEEY